MTRRTISRGVPRRLVEKCSGITFWGLTDEYAWLADPQWGRLGGRPPHLPTRREGRSLRASRFLRWFERPFEFGVTAPLFGNPFAAFTQPLCDWDGTSAALPPRGQH